MDFQIKSNYSPLGDQPQAIEKLVAGVRAYMPHQVLLGVTGSGKTFTLANVIGEVKLPTLVIAHNKTLAAQLYQEFRDFFPNNAVSYFVSYYDYYQPEAYIPRTDTYIEKETDINQEIDRLRLSTTTNLLTRPDCIVVASVSCLYNLGSPVDYGQLQLELMVGQVIDRGTILARLVDLHYARTSSVLTRGSFRVLGEVVELWPAYEEKILRIVFTDKTLTSLIWVDSHNFEPLPEQNNFVTIFAAKHYVSGTIDKKEAFTQIQEDMQKQVERFKTEGKIVEAYRLEQKVTYDLEMIETMGYVNGIENYSRYFDGRQPGDAPYTLLDYMAHSAKLFDKSNFLTILDESHMSIPQIQGMFRGDQSRKQTLIDYGFRLPASLDNRPLRWEEFAVRSPQIIYTSATPTKFEISLARTTGKGVHEGVVEQLVRPTGLLDPRVEVRPIEGQIKDLTAEILKRKALGQRALVTVMTKRMAEDLSEYLGKLEEIKVTYLHSEVNTLDRSDILDNLRLGEVDVVIGINLLREGLDLPEVSLVAILDADKEGFLRSYTSLMQTMGRAARHQDGLVILYANKITDSMRLAMEEVTRRRQKQEEYNLAHGITPQTIVKPIREKLLKREKKEENEKKIPELASFGWASLEEVDPKALTPSDKEKLMKRLKKLMNQAAKDWDFEQAAKLRDKINLLELSER